MKVRLSGGPNHGRIIEVLHGNSILVHRLRTLPPFDPYEEIAAVPFEYDVYRRPNPPTPLENGLEVWVYDETSST